MLLLGGILGIVTWTMGDALTANPDRVGNVLGALIGLLVGRGLAGIWQVYRRVGRAEEG